MQTRERFKLLSADAPNEAAAATEIANAIDRAISAHIRDTGGKPADARRAMLMGVLAYTAGMAKDVDMGAAIILLMKDLLRMMTEIETNVYAVDPDGPPPENVPAEFADMVKEAMENAASAVKSKKGVH